MLLATLGITAILICIVFVMKECGCFIGMLASVLVLLFWLYLVAGKLGLV